MKFKQIAGLTLCLWMAATGFDAIAQDDSGSYLSHYPDINEPDTLQVIDKSDMSLAEYQMITSLQGLLAQTKPRIYITDRTSYDFWLESIKNNYGITTEARSDAMAILDEFKNEVSGYLLTEGGGVPGGWGTEETNAATSLSGIKNGIVISESLESEVKDLGLEMILDVRNMTNEEVFNDYKDELNNNLVFMQNFNIMQLRDYAIATEGFVYHETEEESEGFEQQIFDWVANDSPQFGWVWAYHNVSQKDEREFVGDAGSNGIFTNPSDWVLNLSTLAGVRKDTLKQNREEATTENIETPEEAHYLAINMSDGDNYSFVLQGLADEGKYFDSESGGKFAMNWTMPGSMIDLAPAAMEWYYQEARDTDYFVIGGTGSGYMFPSEYPYLEEHLEIVNEYMGRSDLAYIGMLDPADFGSSEFYETAETYTAQPNIEGVYYLNYYQYEKGAGQIEFINGKPVVAVRENMWGLDDSQIVDLAEKINNHSKNPEKRGAYTIMNLHAWTHNLEDAELLVDNLDPHVKVVNMDELFMQIKKNVEPEAEPDIVYGDNILTNNDFTDGFNQWSLVKDQSSADFQETDEIFFSGDNGDVLTYIGYNLLQVFSDRVQAEPGKHYKLEVNTKVSGEHTDQANYKIRFYDDNGDFLDEVEEYMPANTDGFVTKEATMQAPDNAAEMNIELAVWAENPDLEIQVDEVKLMPGEEKNTSVESTENRPEDFTLKQNYPNPFNPSTRIEYSLEEASDVTLEVFNMQGQRVTTLVNKFQGAGEHNVNFNASSLSSGMYIYRLKAGNYVEVKKMSLVK